jgi:phototropin
MEPPVIPMSRTRLTKDYTLDDDVPPAIKRHREGTPRGYEDADHHNSPRTNGHRQRSNSHERPVTSVRMRGFERSDSYNNGHVDPPLQEHAQEHEDLRKLDFNLDPINEQSTYAASITSTTRSQITDARSVAPSGSSTSKLPDFFSSEIFQIVLHNPMTARQLQKFAQQRLCAENMEFLTAVDRYQSLLNDVAKNLFDIHKSFISSQAEQQINLPEHVMSKLNKDLKATLSSTLPKLESIFSGSQHDIEQLVSSDLYPRFVRHQMTLSASRALAGNRSKYAGLGDCFVLTDPAKADNPITFASDGFVAVTGYTRNEIIPRNCRFLQNRHTDRNSVRRIKSAVEAREESVELILNERKDGSPFWNLLYVTPLRDAQGKIVFFLGAQINLSTTIHSQSDILRILALNEDVAEEKQPSMTNISKESSQSSSRASRLFSSFRSKSSGVVPKATPGMEPGLLGRLEKLGVRGQMDAFYTAYSKVGLVSPRHKCA